MTRYAAGITRLAAGPMPGHSAMRTATLWLQLMAAAEALRSTSTEAPSTFPERAGRSIYGRSAKYKYPAQRGFLLMGYVRFWPVPVLAGHGINQLEECQERQVSGPNRTFSRI